MENGETRLAQGHLTKSSDTKGAYCDFATCPRVVFYFSFHKVFYSSPLNFASICFMNLLFVILLKVFPIIPFDHVFRTSLDVFYSLSFLYKSVYKKIPIQILEVRTFFEKNNRDKDARGNRFGLIARKLASLVN
jgi:hypothetical protein